MGMKQVRGPSDTVGMRRLSVLVLFLAGCPTDSPAKHVPDAAIDAPVVRCPHLTGSGTMHTGAIATAETWTAADSPHIIPSDTSIRATVTLEACAVVRIADSKTLEIRGGTLIANGEPDRPVTI